MSEPGVDVIVVNYRTPLDLRDFLNSYQQFGPSVPSSLTIVNVSPTDEDTKVAHDFNDSLVIEFEDNVGYAKSCNYAASLCRREIIAIFNADVVLTENAVDDVCKVLLAHDDWAVAGPYQHNGNYRTTHAGIFGTREQPRHRAWMEHTHSGLHDVRDDAVYVSGSAFFVKRKFWQELTECPAFQKVSPGALGAFLPTELFYEESWCCAHALEHGLKIGYVGSVQIIHKWHQAIQKNGLEEESHRKMARSKQQFREACTAHGMRGER